MIETAFKDVVFAITDYSTARQVLNPPSGNPPWTHVVSLGDVGSLPATRPRQWGDRLLRLTFPDETPPKEAVRQIAAFGVDLPPGARVLFHCQMGLSRSPAAATILLLARFPDVDYQEVDLAVFAARKASAPNVHMLRLWWQIAKEQA